MARPFRWEVNVQTGERKQLDLTDAEIADAQARKVAEDAKHAAEQLLADRKAARQAKLDALLDKIEADPTLLDRIR